MKLLRLDLLRYGHLTDVALAFPETIALHVVQGENEAGKSTALAAIADALFGFGHRTDFDFQHGASQLRIGFTLMASDGTRGVFVRRKGRRDTLRDAGEQVVSEQALRRFLGSASRELFERGFGLNGVRLREGSQELLRSGGEVGESLLAGVGLLNLRAALNQIDEEAKSLVGDGRGRRRLAETVEAWRAAQLECEQRTVLPDAWKQAETERAEAVEELTRLQEKTRRLTAESNRLQRYRRVASLLAQISEARGIVAELTDAPRFPADAQERFRRAVEMQRDAKRDMEREAAAAERLSTERAALQLDEQVFAVQDVIDGLTEQRSVVVQAINDLPAVEAKVATHRATVAEALKELDLELSPEAARDAVPGTLARRTVQRLLNEHAALSAKATSAMESLAAALRRRANAERDLRAAPVPASPALLRRTIDAVREEGRLDAEFARADDALSDAEQATAIALAALPLWHGDIASLAAAKLPMPAGAEKVAARLDGAEKALADVRAERDRLIGEIDEREDEMSRLARGETVPTPDAVGAARQARDRAWRLIRRKYEGGSSPSADEAAELPQDSLPDAFESLRDAADHLADRRADEAQRVSDFLAVRSHLNHLRTRLADVDAAVISREHEVAGETRAWRLLWEPSGVIADVPAAMAEWRRRREEVLNQARTEDEARRLRDELAHRRDHARAALLAMLPGRSEAQDESLAALMRRAQTACAAAETAEQAYRGLEKSLADEERRLPELREGVHKTEVALRAWQEKWMAGVEALGLPGKTSVDVAELALGAWNRIAEVAPEWRTDERRIAEMTATISAFTAAVNALLAQLSEPQSDVPAPLVIARASRRLAHARAAESNAKGLTKQIAGHRATLSKAEAYLRVAEHDLDELRRLAAANSDAELERALERAARRDAKSNEITQLEQALLAQGDGLTEEALRAEATHTDPDAAAVRLAEIEEETSRLGEQREKFSAQRTTAEATLAEMGAGHDAVAKAQEAADALADAQAAVERYARLHVARVLLRSGIERFRKDQQGPLLRAAGRHFSMLSTGRYVRIVADQDSAGHVILLAVRDDGSECPVQALSDGARDQLYLALRVAAVEAYGTQAEGLPFIADDLLASFDDARAASAIALLTELGRTTQVILFTHHSHIARLASSQPDIAIQRLPSIVGEPTPSLAAA